MRYALLTYSILPRTPICYSEESDITRQTLSPSPTKLIGLFSWRPWINYRSVTADPPLGGPPFQPCFLDCLPHEGGRINELRSSRPAAVQGTVIPHVQNALYFRQNVRAL